MTEQKDFDCEWRQANWMFPSASRLGVRAQSRLTTTGVRPAVMHHGNEKTYPSHLERSIICHLPGGGAEIRYNSNTAVLVNSVRANSSKVLVSFDGSWFGMPRGR